MCVWMERALMVEVEVEVEMMKVLELAVLTAVTVAQDLSEMPGRTESRRGRSHTAPPPRWERNNPPNAAIRRLFNSFSEQPVSRAHCQGGDDTRTH